MANEIVKYSNQFNAQALRRFTALDLDLLMAIAARVRDKEIDEVTFTFEELRQLAHVKKNLTDKELAARIVEVNDRLLACRFRFQDDSRTVQFTLFSGFETDWKTAKLLVAVNPRFSFLLNDLTSQFTRFELAEFTALKSSYAKETYRRLKQYRQTGVWKVSLEEFRRLLDVPKSYRTCDLNERVLKPIQAELGELLGLRIHKKYAKRGGRGRSSLVGFEFEFDPEKVPGGVSAPRVELSPGVVADAARKSLRDAARADARPVEARKAEDAGHWTSVAGYGEVFTTTELFDVTAARDHFDGTVEAGECRFCAFDARNREHHAQRRRKAVLAAVSAPLGRLRAPWVDLPLFGLPLACEPVRALSDLVEQVGLGPGGLA